jgi:tRNA (guanine-N7-)-methyltransferase
MRARGSFQPQAGAAGIFVGRNPQRDPEGGCAAAATAPVADSLSAEMASGGPWEVELGFGKGRYLLARAAAEPLVSFLGIEVVGEFFRLAAGRAARRGLDNVVLVQAEALYALDALLPRGFARALHVYFPDPWPKPRQKKRRLFEVDTVDLLLGVLRPEGKLHFASDHLAYAERVLEVLSTHPALRVEVVEGPWDDGARTNYEAKYMTEGRPIRRLIATLRGAGPCDAGSLLHPAGVREVAVAWRRVEDEAGGPERCSEGEGGESEPASPPVSCGAGGIRAD